MDSTMMWIVHNAMNKAHAEMKTKGGVLERLNGISRFYELAAMQLEGCLKFVREETSYILESSDEQVLSDLSDIRDRLHLRLKESEMAIKDKDIELASLREKLNKPVEECTVGNRVSEAADDDRDSEICELKNAVDQQVWHIRQQLGPEYKSKGEEGNAEILEGLNNKKIEHLDSDIGTLKETLDLAFGKMQKAIFGSEVRPMEQQWQEAVERDIMSVLLEGFTRDLLETVEEHVYKKQEKQEVCFFGLKEYWSDLMSEVENLRRDLEPLVAQNEVPRCNATIEKSSGDDFNHVKQEQDEEEKKEEEGHLVSKMIKNHESIIKMKSAEAEELNTLKREILRHKTNLSNGREEDTFVKKRMQEVMVKLEKLMTWDAKFQESFSQQETPSQKTSPRSDATFSENLELDTLSEIWAKMDKVPYGVDEKHQNEGRMLKQEHEQSDLKDFMMKEIYVTVLENLLSEKCVAQYDNELESMLWTDICQILFSEFMKEWKEDVESDDIESRIRGELCCITQCTVFNEAIKDYGSRNDLAVAESRNLRAENNLEAAIREDICLIILRETTKKWTERTADNETACLLREEIDQLVFLEAVKEITDIMSRCSAQQQDSDDRNFLNSAENFVKEDIYEFCIREKIKEWKMELSAFDMENIMRGEIFQFVIAEALEDAFVMFEEHAYSGNQERFSKPMSFTNHLHNSRQVNRSDETVSKNIGSSLCRLELQEEMDQIQDRNADLDVLNPERKAGSCVLDTLFLQFSDKYVNLQHATNEKLDRDFSRMDNMKHDVDKLAVVVSSLRKKESLYREAFRRRCHDLWKAETEVDLLGDQVDALLSLLEKIYIILYQHSPTLQPYFEVSDILELIKKELGGVYNASKD